MEFTLPWVGELIFMYSSVVEVVEVLVKSANSKRRLQDIRCNGWDSFFIKHDIDITTLDENFVP